MAIAHDSTRVTISGTMFGGAEIWSTGFWLGEENAAADPPTQAAANAILGLWGTLFETFGNKFSNSFVTSQVKMATILEEGVTLSNSVVYAYPGGLMDGGDPNHRLPAQCSVVVSLLSDRPRGLASKGRMYLPGFSGEIQGNGKISDNDHGNLATGVEAFFNGVRAHVDITNPPILVAKGTGAVPALTAQNDYIERIKVGNVVDTQRRRRNGLVETYLTKVLV